MAAGVSGQYVAPADAHLEALAATFDEVYNAEWERVAESAEGSSASGVADRAATIAGIRAVHAALLAKLEAADRAVDEALQCFNAAYAEGLHERLMEHFGRDDGSVAGLVERRLLPAIDILLAYRNQQPAGGVDDYAPVTTLTDYPRNEREQP